MTDNKYFLYSKRLVFRTWNLGDLDLAIGFWGDLKVTKLVDSRGQLSNAQVKNRLRDEISLQNLHGVQYWPIFNLKTGEHVGCAGLRPYDESKRVMEIGFHIRPKFWRQGFALEAASAVIDYAFNTKHVSGLFAGHSPQNIASANLLKKLGFQYTHDEYYEPTGLMHPSYFLTNG
jgi:RimJ/RimL family protein N-acetyltransferase